MTREEFIKQRCEIDKITEEEFEKRYRVVKCNCGQPYCKGYRCLDLDGLLKENQKLKKQLEENQNPLKGIFAQVNDDTLLRDCGNMNAEINELKNQQKEFIKYLESEIDRLEKTEFYIDSIQKAAIETHKHNLSKYKEIIEEDTKLNKINLNYSVPNAIYDMKVLRETLEEIIENQRIHEDRINELIDEVNKLKGEK